MKDRWGRLLVFLYVGLVGFGGLVLPDRTVEGTNDFAPPTPPVVISLPCEDESDPFCAIWRPPPTAELVELAQVKAEPAPPDLEEGEEEPTATLFP